MFLLCCLRGFTLKVRASLVLRLVVTVRRRGGQRDCRLTAAAKQILAYFNGLLTDKPLAQTPRLRSASLLLRGLFRCRDSTGWGPVVAPLHALARDDLSHQAVVGEVREKIRVAAVGDVDNGVLFHA